MKISKKSQDIELKKCVVCGAAFIPRSINNITCSYECSIKHKDDTAKEHRKGRAGSWHSKEKPLRMYSYQPYSDRNIRTECKHCGKEFIKKTPKQVYCCKECQTKHRWEKGNEKEM